MRSAWIRSAEHPTRRFGDEWLVLDPTACSVLVVRGAPAIAAMELLAQPRDLDEVVTRVEEATRAPVAERLRALFDELRAGRRLVAATSSAVPVAPLERIAVEPIGFFSEAIALLFSGLSAPSHPGSAGLVQHGHGVPCGR
jgi:hypothetical protein